MIKKYGRKKANYFGWIVFGLMLIWEIYTENTVVIIYNGLFLVGAIISLIYGFWGLFTPLVKIIKNTIELKLFPFVTKTINLEQIHEIGYDKVNQFLKFDSFKFDLYKMKSDCREEFINELKLVREKIKSNNQHTSKA